MRVAFVSAVFPPTRGGMCTVAAAEANALAAIHDVTVFTLATRDPRKDLIADRACRARVVRLTPFPRISLSGFVPQLLWHLRGFDVVYAQLPAYGFLEVLLLWKWWTRRRLVVTVHMDPIGSNAWYKIGFVLQRLFLRAVLRVSDSVRVSTARLEAASLLSGARRRGVTNVIPFGIDLKKFYPAAAGQKKSGHVYLFVGALSHTHYFKGVELLIKSFQLVVAMDHDSELWIVGDGEQRTAYERLTVKLKIASRVKFLGSVADDELGDVYRAASIMVLPSTDTSETFGLVLLEAMACGVPVIASRLPGVDALVFENETGVLIEPGNEVQLSEALVDASRARAEWQARGIAARSHAAQFGDWTTIAHRVSALL